MLQKILAGALLITLSAGMIGCGGGEKKTAEVPTQAKAEAAQPAAPDYLKSYAFIMDGIYDYAVRGLDDKLVNEGAGGIREVVEYNKEKSGDVIGYALQDFNGDAVPELVLGHAAYKQGAGYYGTDIYAVYTLVDGRPLRAFEGSLKNRLQYLRDDRFFWQQANGAAQQMLGAYVLSPTGEPVCIDYYFSAPDENNPAQLGFYHNTDGRLDKNAAEKLAITADEFFARGEIYLHELEQLELIPLKNYHKQGAKGLARQHIKLEWLRTSDVDVKKCERVTLPNAAPEMTVVFKSDKPLAHFKVLVLSLKNIDYETNAITYDKKEVYSKDLLMADEPVLLELAVAETAPANGVSFEDELGRTRQFALGVSGVDGSLIVNEF